MATVEIVTQFSTVLSRFVMNSEFVNGMLNLEP